MAEQKYVTALEPLYVGGVLAHNKGDDRVPVENVERNGWQDQVASPSSKAAKNAAES